MTEVWWCFVSNILFLFALPSHWNWYMELFASLIYLMCWYEKELAFFGCYSLWSSMQIRNIYIGLTLANKEVVDDESWPKFDFSLNCCQSRESIIHSYIFRGNRRIKKMQIEHLIKEGDACMHAFMCEFHLLCSVRFTFRRWYGNFWSHGTFSEHVSSSADAGICAHLLHLKSSLLRVFVCVWCGCNVYFCVLLVFVFSVDLKRNVCIGK